MHFIWQVEKSRNTELEKHYLVIFSATVWLCLSLSALCMIFLIQLKCSTCIWDSCWHRNLLLSISLKGCFCHLQKCVFYLKSLNGTSFVKHHVVVLFCPGLPLGSRHCTISLLIKFVSDTDEWEWLWVCWSCIFIESVSPSTQSIETLGICDVINQSAAISSTVEGVPKGLELFLPCSIPNLKCDHCIVY